MNKIDDIEMSAEDYNEYMEYKNKAEYYDRMQYVLKILLNSAYGSFGDQYFKFFDLRIAESTTRTGREILFHMAATVSELIDGEYKIPENRKVMDAKTGNYKDEFHSSTDSIVYFDTDSCFFLTHTDNSEDSKKVGYAVEKEVNKSFTPFCRDAFNSSNPVIQCGLDLTSTKAIFLKKKYYVMHLDHYDGNDCDKMKVMGLQIKTTKIPKVVGRELTKFVERLLKDDTWRDIQSDIIDYKDSLMNDPNLLNAGLPRGIRGIEEYYERWKNQDPSLRLPGHVAASIFYNECLEKYGDLESPKIVSGSRLKLFYLTKTFGKFKSIAVPTDLKVLPEWFIMNFSPIIDMEAQAVRLIDKPLEGILQAIDERVPTKQILLYEDLVEY